MNLQPSDDAAATVRLWSLSEDVLVEADTESDSLVAVTKWGEFTVGAAGEVVRESLVRMSLGPVSLGNVTGNGRPDEPGSESSGRADAGGLAAVLDLLSGSVVHSLGLCDGSAPLLSAVPVVADAAFPLRPLDPERSVRLSRFAALRPCAGGLLIDSPLAQYQVYLHELQAVQVASLLGAARSIDDLAASLRTSREVVADIVAFLVASGAVLAADQGGGFAEDTDPAMRLWSPHELLFHTRSRSRITDCPVERDIDTGSTLPVVKPVPDGKRFELYRPEPGVAGADGATLTELLEDDHHCPPLSADTVTAEGVGELLYRSARVRSVGPSHLRAEAGAEASQRPYFNVACLYELELYVSVHRCTGLPNGIYHYDAGEHALTVVNDSETDLAMLLDMAKVAAGGTRRPAVLLTVTARMGRVAGIFGGATYATVLMHVGALQQTLYLTAKAMGLAAHAVPADASVAVDKVLGLEWPNEISVRECVLDSYGR